MRKFKYIIYSMVALLLVVTSCQEDDAEFGDVTAPSNLQIAVDIVGADASNPNGDGSGVVNFTTTATNAISYQYVYNGSRTSAPNGEQSYNFANLGLNTYSVTVIAFGTGGASTSETIDVDVLSLYEPPADLITMLTADSSRTWRIKSETGSHFGLGPVGGGFNEWYQASAEEKAGVGMYDDRYIFNVDGTFTHITNSTNDDGGVNTDGTVFGREVLIDELNGTGGPGTANGADIENYPYSDYTAQWSLSAPGGVETLSLSGIAFLGYYIGGDHTYKIEMRSANEMSVRSTDGNGEFDWGFILTSEEGGNVVDYELVWSDEFNTDGAPDAANWTYDLGAGGWGNGEVQTYTSNAENVIVEGGVLKITAKADGSGGYTSARIKSQGLQQFTYGKIEISAKLPSAEGTWPALWMLGSNFPTVGWPQSGEMDIMEQTGWDKGTTLGTCHWFDNGTNANASYGETTAVANASTEFHLYSIEWDETSIKISLDEVPYMTLANNPDLPFNADFFFIMNIAMGGTLGGTINPAFTEDTMEVDYIRVYQ